MIVDKSSICLTDRKLLFGAAMEPKRADEENKRALERRDLGLRDQNSPAFPESYVDM